MHRGLDSWIRLAAGRITSRRTGSLFLRHFLLCAIVVVVCVPALGIAESAGPGAPEFLPDSASGDGFLPGLPGGVHSAAASLQSPAAVMAQAPPGVAGVPAAPSAGSPHADARGSNASKPPREPKEPKDKKPKKGEEPPPPPPPAPEPPVGLVATSGDMYDSLSWSAPATGTVPAVYEVAVGTGAAGPFESLLQTDATSCSIEVTQTAVRYYAVRSVSGSLESSFSAPAANGHVSMSADVPPSGHTLRASNGEVELVLPAGAYAATTTVTVEEDEDATLPPSLLSLAGVYDIEPSGALSVPATLKVRCEVSVAHFQIADKLLAAAELMTRNQTTGTWVVGSADAHISGGWLEGTVTHFSYWSGATIQPHGTTPSKTSYCSGICHNLIAAPGSPQVIPNRDPVVCFFCHGNALSTDPPAGASGPNIEALFIECDDQVFNPATQSRHPAATTTADWMACVDCHDPHRDPAASADLLRAYDAVTGRAVRGGADFCWACHGTKKNARIDAAVPGYWTRAGGDKKTGLLGTPHAAISSTSAVGVCGECHASHGSTNKGLVRTEINGKAVTRNHTVFTHDNSACYACHESAVRTYPGQAVFGASIHWPAGCEGCHDPHGKPGIPSLLNASEENGCYSCHDGNENPPCNNCHKAAVGMANPNIEQQMGKALRVPVEWSAKVQLDNRGTYPYGISLGDLDGDGDLDVACGGYDNLLAWYENTAGDGSAWLEREVYTATSTVLSSRIRDVDGDGDEDIISGTAFGPDYHVRFHENVNGDGTLWSESVVWSGSGGASAGIWVLDVEDVDNDTDLDVVSGGYQVGLHYNENVNGDASVWDTTLISSERATALRIADMDDDGDGDVVSGDFSVGGRLYYHENVNGDGSSWGSVQFFDGGAKANWLDIGDLDGDLSPDVVAVFDTSAGDNDRTRAFFNTAGDGSSWMPQTVFDWSRWSGVYHNPTVVRVADATGDGALDVFTSNEAEHVYLSEDRYPDGPEWWTTYVVKGPGYAISTMDVGDVDADGDVDIVYGGKSGPFGPIFYVANEGRSLGASGSHPTNSLSNRHSPGEDSPGVGIGNRHAECADCHDPHSAVYGVHTMGENTAPGVLAGVSGVAVSNLTSWTAPVYAEVDEVSFEYELCFRCHSSYTTGYTGSDKALRFNALNASFHPVEAVGTNVGVWDSAFTLGTPWNPTSGDDPDYGVTSPKMTCTDCHASDRESEPRGPHGSEWPTLLRGNFTSIDQADWSQAGVCWVCHDISAYIVQSVTGPSRINHGHFWNEGAFCTDCHDVHGSNQPHLLSIPYSHTPTGGSLDLTGWTDCSSHHGVSKPYEASY